MSDKGPAFIKGGFGCLLGFFAIGLIFVLLGGSMHINPGGAICLFVVGGVIGLVVLAIYSKGQRDAKDRRFVSREMRSPQQHSEHTDVRQAARREMQCPHCVARVDPATGKGLHPPLGEPWIWICDKCETKIEPES